MNTRRFLLRQSLDAWVTSDTTPPGPAWLQWLWTLIFALAVGLVFTLVGMANAGARRPEIWLDGWAWMRWFRVNFAISLTISVLIHLLFSAAIAVVGVQRIRAFSNGQRGIFFSSIPILGVLIGWPLGVWLVSEEGAGWIRIDAASLVGSAILGILISTVIYLVFNARAQKAEAEKRAAEAQLRLLQAQMEPHFLFNTLANVLTLIDIEPQRARQMLESFTDYLRATLANLRKDESTLGRELDLADAYLRLLQLRMEDRLTFTIDADAESRQAVLPPLLLHPLVENAIHHGLEPKLEGGSIAIRARVQEGVLLLSVTDDGLGPDAPKRRSTGHGIALDNIRQRLRARHGDGASLSLEALQPGTRATLRLPFTRSPA
jgi:two-component sensor histidine kinase